MILNKDMPKKRIRKDSLFSTRKFCIVFLTVFIGGLLFCGIVNAVVDPLFHYHAPIKGLSYSLYDERYQNDGIVRHFTYDAMITGTSMTENASASLVSELYDVNCIKTCFRGGSYREISDNIRTALENNPSLKLVIRATDQFDIISAADSHISTNPDSGYDYPAYIMDDDIFNDVHYILGKSFLIDSVTDIKMTIKKTPSTTFDEYMNWDALMQGGKESVLAGYTRPAPTGEQTALTDEEREMIKENIQKNIIDLANDYPGVTFMIWIPPYSIAYYDAYYRAGLLDKSLEAMEIECEMLTGVSNIRLYGYLDRADIVTDFDRFKDLTHFDERTNNEFLKLMAEDEGLITSDNMSDYMKRVRDLYMDYDYDRIFE